jgi:hypothetical protein
VLVDEAQWVANDVAPGRVTYPFIQRDGQYWGAPADDEQAIQELELLRRAGANYVAFGWPAFWWLDHYAGFEAYLRAHFTCVLRNDRFVVFDLREASDESRQEARRRRAASPNLMGG